MQTTHAKTKPNLPQNNPFWISRWRKLMLDESPSFGQCLSNMTYGDAAGSFFNGQTLRSIAGPQAAKSLILNLAYVRNPLGVTLVELGLKNKADVIFESGQKMPGVGRENLHIFKAARLLQRRGYPLSINGDRFEFEFNGKQLSIRMNAEGLGAIGEVFFDQPYKMDCKGKTVVDIGAHIGDSAIFFAMSGAAHVISLEPFGYSYGIAAENVNANGLSDKISLLQAAIGGRSGEITIDPLHRNNTGSRAREFASGEKVRVMTLEEIVIEHDLQDALLKVDCEGAEHGVITGAKTWVLNRFKEIITEFHFGYGDIWARLSDAGFRLEMQSPAICIKNGEDGYVFLGMIHGTRID